MKKIFVCFIFLLFIIFSGSCYAYIHYVPHVAVFSSSHHFSTTSNSISNTCDSDSSENIDNDLLNIILSLLLAFLLFLLGFKVIRYFINSFL